MGRRRKLPYREGTWFSVPLTPSGYAIGIVSRMDGKGTVWGYFFGPVRGSSPVPEDIQNLGSQDAAASYMFGDLGLLDGDWPVLCDSEDWRREDWPLPAFVRTSPEDGWAFKIVYSDADLSLISEEPCSLDLADELPPDLLDGSGAIEIMLSRQLVGVPKTL